MRTVKNSGNEKTGSLWSGICQADRIRLNDRDKKQKKRNGSDIWIRNGILKWAMW